VALSFKDLEAFIEAKLLAEWPTTECPILIPLLNQNSDDKVLYMEPIVDYLDSAQSEIGPTGLVRTLGVLRLKITTIKGVGKAPLMRMVDVALGMFQRKVFLVPVAKQLVFEEGIPDSLIEEQNRASLTINFIFTYEQVGG